MDDNQDAIFKLSKPFLNSFDEQARRPLIKFDKEINKDIKIGEDPLTYADVIISVLGSGRKGDDVEEKLRDFDIVRKVISSRDDSKIKLELTAKEITRINEMVAVNGTVWEVGCIAEFLEPSKSKEKDPKNVGTK